MRRLVIACCAFLLSIGVEVTTPSVGAATPPPPCPDGETFQFCEDACPAFLASFCLNAINAPPGCTVANTWCQSYRDQGLDCYGNVVDPDEWPLPIIKNAAIWCTYQSG